MKIYGLKDFSLTDPDDPFKITHQTRYLGLVVCRGTAVVASWNKQDTFVPSEWHVPRTHFFKPQYSSNIQLNPSQCVHYLELPLPLTSEVNNTY